MVVLVHYGEVEWNYLVHFWPRVTSIMLASPFALAEFIFGTI